MGLGEKNRNLPDLIEAGHTTGKPTMSNAQRAEEPLPHANNDLLTRKEVAAVLRVPEATLRYWRYLGTGPRGFRVGRSVRYWRTEVALWLEQQSRRPRDEL